MPDVTRPTRARLTAALLALTTLLIVSSARADESVATGMQSPESAQWDATTGAWYVSNGGSYAIGGGKDGNGGIMRIRPGSNVAEEFVTGLDSPLGIAIHAGRIYAADIDQVVVVDIASATIADVIPLGASGANDVAVDPATGDVYVSGFISDLVWRIPGGVGPAHVFLQTPELETPNGLLVDDGALFVGGWGAGAFRSSVDPTAGRILRVDLATKAITPFSPPIGGIDGLVRASDSYLASDWLTGRLWRVSLDGSTVTLVAQLAPSAADIGYDPVSETVAVPELIAHSVVFLHA